MTTNNHPAYGPVSLDRLFQIREILSKAAAQSDGGNLGYAMADAVKVIDGAIEAFGAEPVAVNDDMAYTFHHALSDSSLGADEVEEIKIGLRAVFANIAAPQPAPVMPDAIVEPSDYVTAAQLVGECPARKAVHELYEGALRIGDKLYRHATPAPVVPENCVTAEHRRVIEMLLNVCGAAFELADDSCQQDVDGEECNVVPDDAFQKLSDALDEIENTLPTEDADRPDVFLAWSAIPRAALKSILQAGNSPESPDGWQLVPKEPTQAMNKAGWDAMNEHDAINPTYRAMLAAAPLQAKSQHKKK